MDSRRCLLSLVIYGIVLDGCRNRQERETPPTASSTPAPSAPAQPQVASAPSSSVTADSGSAARVVDIQAGADHTFILLSSGRALGFGDNAFGVLGLGKDIKSVSTPTEVPGLTEARQLSTGTWHSCAIDAEAKALCWGRNFGGALGTGSNADKTFAPPTPVVDLTSAAEIRAGGSYTCARSTDGTASCWGLVVSGTVARPARVPKLEPVAMLSVATDRACALGRDGATFCWGVALGLDFDYGAAIDGRDGISNPRRELLG